MNQHRETSGLIVRVPYQDYSGPPGYAYLGVDSRGRPYIWYARKPLGHLLWWVSTLFAWMTYPDHIFLYWPIPLPKPTLPIRRLKPHDACPPWHGVIRGNWEKKITYTAWMPFCVPLRWIFWNRS